MRDRSPCIGCKHRSAGCQSRCEIGRAYFKWKAEERDRANAERRKDKAFDSFKSERVAESKKRAGLER